VLALVERVIPCRFSVPHKVDRFSLGGQSLADMRSKERAGIVGFLEGLVPAKQKIQDAAEEHADFVEQSGQIEEHHAADQDQDRTREFVSVQQHRRRGQ